MLVQILSGPEGATETLGAMTFLSPLRGFTEGGVVGESAPGADAPGYGLTPPFGGSTRLSLSPQTRKLSCDRPLAGIVPNREFPS